MSTVTKYPGQQERADLWKKQTLWKADLLIRGRGEHAMDYENAVLSLKSVTDVFLTLPGHDVAFNHFARQVVEFSNLCTAHALLDQEKDGVVRLDHLVPVNVIWSYDKGNVLEETVLYVPYGTRESRMEWVLRLAGTTRLAREGVPAVLANTLEIEVL